MKELELEETKLLDCDSGALERFGSNFARMFPGAAACIVADLNTWSAAGREVYGSLREAGVKTVKPFVMDDEPHGDEQHVDRVREALAAAQVPDGAERVIAVAVGAGTINDLCKLATHQLGMESYACFATGASVDGFLSFGAAIASKSGFKITRSCPAPRFVCADPAILARAPKVLASSGYGDLFGKFTAGADWILTNEITGEEINQTAWKLVQEKLREWTIHPKELADGSEQVLNDVFMGLAASGIAMQISRSSRPASGAEHLFAHVWTMSHVLMPDGSTPYHGHQVAVGSLCELVFYIKLFARDFTRADIDAAVSLYPSWQEREALIRSLLPAGEMCESTITESKAKHLSPEELRARLEMAASKWSSLRDKVNERLMYFPRMRAMLMCAGCPVTPSEIGLTPERAAASAVIAQMIRRRYTVLDLAYETGRFAECMQGIVEAFSVDSEIK